MKKQTKIKLILFLISSIVTYFMFCAAQTSAFIERNNTYGIGGEYCLWFIPFIVVYAYENIILSKSVFKKSSDRSSKRYHILGTASVNKTKSASTFIGGNHEV